jgi:hypothetical protein
VLKIKKGLPFADSMPHRGPAPTAKQAEIPLSDKYLQKHFYILLRKNQTTSNFQTTKNALLMDVSKNRTH